MTKTLKITGIVTLGLFILAVTVASPLVGLALATSCASWAMAMSD